MNRDPKERAHGLACLRSLLIDDLASLQRLVRAIGARTRRRYRRLHPHRPRVYLDSGPDGGGRLRRELARTACQTARVLGAELPPHVTVLVQRAVHHGRPLDALLQAFEPAPGRRHYLITLATSVDGRDRDAADLRLALRAQVVRLLEDVVGGPVLSVPLAMPHAGPRPGAPLVALWPEIAAGSAARPAFESNRRHHPFPVPPVGDGTA